MAYPRIDPVMLNDEDGYWLASYNWDIKKLAVVGYHFWPCGSDRTSNAAQKVVCFLRATGFTCEGYWEGFVGNMVSDCWSADSDLQDEGENPICGAEGIALRRLVDENPNFLQELPWGEFVRLDWWDEKETS